jgi:hypothetical protein
MMQLLCEALSLALLPWLTGWYQFSRKSPGASDRVNHFQNHTNTHDPGQEHPDG